MLQSLLNVMKKELSQTMRDRRMLGTLIISPVLQLVVFGYAIDLDVDRIPTVVCDQDGTPQSRELAQAFFADRTFLRSGDVASPAPRRTPSKTGSAAAAFIIPRGFALRAARADAPEVQVLVDGTDCDASAGRGERGEPVLAHAGDRCGAERAARGRGRVARAPRDVQRAAQDADLHAAGRARDAAPERHRARHRDGPGARARDRDARAGPGHADPAVACSWRASACRTSCSASSTSSPSSFWGT